MKTVTIVSEVYRDSVALSGVDIAHLRTRCKAYQCSVTSLAHTAVKRGHLFADRPAGDYTLSVA